MKSYLCKNDMDLPFFGHLAEPKKKGSAITLWGHMAQPGYASTSSSAAALEFYKPANVSNLITDSWDII